MIATPALPPALAFSSDEMRPLGRDLLGPNPQQTLKQYIQQDHGLPPDKKATLLALLAEPGQIDRLLAGAAGAYLMHTVSKYLKLGTPTRTLLSLAGFGLGNILYKMIFTVPQATRVDEHGNEHIKL